MTFVRPVIVKPLVEDDPDKSVLTGRFGIFDGLEAKLMIDVPFVQNKVEKLVLDLLFGHVAHVCLWPITYS